MGIATHRGWIAVELDPHKQYWRYVNRGWKLASEAKVKLDRRNRQLIICLTFVRDVEEKGMGALYRSTSMRIMSQYWSTVLHTY